MHYMLTPIDGAVKAEKTQISRAKTPNWGRIGAIIALLLALSVSSVWAQELTASYYSVASLKAEGTYKYSKGVMANGKVFNEMALSCASCDYPLGAVLLVKSLENGKTVRVKVTDRTNRRFKGKRIDLSAGAFAKLDKLSKGLIKVEVKEVN